MVRSRRLISTSSGLLASLSPRNKESDQTPPGVSVGRRSWSGKRLPGHSLRLPEKGVFPGQEEPHRQEVYPGQGEYPGQGGLLRTDEYSGRDEYSERDEYPEQDECRKQDGYPGQSGYPKEDEYPEQNEYPRTNEHTERYECPEQDDYPSQDEHLKQDDYIGQDEYLERNEYPEQNEHLGPDIDPGLGVYSVQDEYPGQNEHPEQDEFSGRSEYPGQEAPPEQFAANATDASEPLDTKLPDAAYEQEAGTLKGSPLHIRTPGTFSDDQDEAGPDEDGHDEDGHDEDGHDEDGQGEGDLDAILEHECERCKWMNERAGLAGLRKEDIECSWADAGTESDGFTGREYKWRIYYVKTRQERDVPHHINIWPSSIKDRIRKRRDSPGPIESPVTARRRGIVTSEMSL